MKISCLIVEDELPNANRLEKLLAQTDFEIVVSGKTETVKETVKWLNTNPKPDIILLDIRLSDDISFNIFKQVEIDVPIIFTTAYHEYALQAFKVNSVDYLLKPVQLPELNAALHKFSKNQISKPETGLVNILNTITQKQTAFRSRFLVSYREEYISINIDEVSYFHSQNKITYLITKEGKRFSISQTMECLENELDPHVFFRATRQLIITQNSITKIISHFNGKIKLELSPDLAKEVLLSRDKSIVLKKWLDK